MDIISIIRGIVGLGFLIGIAYMISASRKNVDWRLVGTGVILQVILALLMLKVPLVRSVFQVIVNFFVIMIESTEESAKFLFGELADPSKPYGFAFFVLPTIIFFSALSSLLYYLGILQKVVYGFAWVMNKTMKLSGAESLAAAANVFIGQTEAPLVVKPYLERMSRSEIMSLMTGGMATIAGGVFGAYMAMLGGDDPEGKALFGMHLLTASIISAPAAIVAAKIIQPEMQKDIQTDIEVPREAAGNNLLDALASGTTDGLKLAVNVGAMLLAFMAFVFLSNSLLTEVGEVTGLNAYIADRTNGTYSGLTIQYITGYIFSPIAFMIGVPATDMVAIGQTLGEKTILNEFIGYLSLVDFKNAGVLTDKSIIIGTYALCGFANFASIGIQIGGIGAIAPGQRKTLTELGIKALIGGTIAALMTASIAGMLYSG